MKVEVVLDEGEDSWNMIVSHQGEVIRTENDYMEPEDASFQRDLRWIPDAIMEAYKIGRKEVMR